ncbi:MAG: PTS sugar transporter subunit IIB [Bacillota bacterium]|nr:PTS sugar transporter subunit IIB [Bacillota bacterium]
MLQVAAACAFGAGSSQIIKMKIEKVLKSLNINAEIHHMSAGEAKSRSVEFDIIFVPQGLIFDFGNGSTSTKIIGIKNLLSEQEIEEKVKHALDIK